MSLLEIMDLRVEYATPRGPVTAVDGASLEVDTGHCIPVLGVVGGVAYWVEYDGPFLRSAPLDGSRNVVASNVAARRLKLR